MAPRLAGRVAVITGAGAGIGWVSALALAAEGARLVVTARRADRLAALAAQLRTRGSEARTYPRRASSPIALIVFNPPPGTRSAKGWGTSAKVLSGITFTGVLVSTGARLCPTVTV